jgi:hypothetical protein
MPVAQPGPWKATVSKTGSYNDRQGWWKCRSCREHKTCPLPGKPRQITGSALYSGDLHISIFLPYTYHLVIRIKVCQSVISGSMPSWN